MVNSIITQRNVIGYQNRTQVTMFEFSGLSDDKKLSPFLFMFFLLVYMMTIAGNLLIIALVYAFSSLHTPMYFFLSSLSLVDIFYSSVITPNMLIHFLSSKKSISFVGCALQLYFFCSLFSSLPCRMTVMWLSAILSTTH